jgi:hypothetical protein
MGYRVFAAAVVRGMSERDDNLPGISGKRNTLRKDTFR